MPPDRISTALLTGKLTRQKMRKYMKDNKMGDDEVGDAISNMLELLYPGAGQAVSRPSGCGTHSFSNVVVGK